MTRFPRFPLPEPVPRSVPTREPADGFPSVIAVPDAVPDPEPAGFLFLAPPNEVGGAKGNGNRGTGGVLDGDLA